MTNAPLLARLNPTKSRCSVLDLIIPTPTLNWFLEDAVGTNIREDPLAHHFSSRVRDETQGMENGVGAQSWLGEWKHETRWVSASTAYDNRSLSANCCRWHGEKLIPPFSLSNISMTGIWLAIFF